MIWMKGTSLKIKNKVLKSFLFTSEVRKRMAYKSEKRKIKLDLSEN